VTAIAGAGEPGGDCALCPRLATFRATQRAAFPAWHNGKQKRKDQEKRQEDAIRKPILQPKRYKQLGRKKKISQVGEHHLKVPSPSKMNLLNDCSNSK